MKRITYLERRHDLTAGQFREHWATTHAEIAKDLPRVLSYRQNHVVQSESPSGEDQPFLVDGIVELWFEDEAAAGAGFGSEVADRLIEDEKKFMAGLTGVAMHAGPPTPEHPYKVWLLAMAADESTREQVEGWAAGVGERLGAAIAVDRAVEGAPILQREALRREAELPDYAIVLMCDERDAAQRALTDLGIVASESGLFRRSQVFLAEELRII